MDIETSTRQWVTNGKHTRRAGCGENRTSGSAGGLKKRTRRNPGTALQADPTLLRPRSSRASVPALFTSRCGAILARCWHLSIVAIAVRRRRDHLNRLVRVLSSPLPNGVRPRLRRQAREVS
jgi:hypothetical protein